MNDEEERRIREEAYHLWVAEGRPHGRHDEHWRDAKQALSKKARFKATPLKGASPSDKSQAKSKRAARATKAEPPGATPPLAAKKASNVKGSKKTAPEKASVSRPSPGKSDALPKGKHQGP